MVDANGKRGPGQLRHPELCPAPRGGNHRPCVPHNVAQSGRAGSAEGQIPVATWGGGLGDGVVISDGDGGPFAQPIVDKMLKDMGGREETQFLK